MPLKQVWAAWTEPKRIAQWWGPRGFTNPVVEWDARPGGRLHVVMRANDEIAKMIVFLTSDVAAWMTGSGVLVDGGAAKGNVTQ